MASKSDEKRYIPCPGAHLGAHSHFVFLEIRPCKKPGSVCADCNFCQCRIFGRGMWMEGGISAADVRANCPPGTAMNGRGQAI